MIPSRGLLRSTPASRFARAALPKPSIRPSSRQFGTALRNNRAVLYGASTTTTRRIGGPLAFTAASQQLFSFRQARNASTESTIPPAATDDGSLLSGVAGTPVSLTGSDLLDIPEQIGFLKTLGLDYGWGPTSLMQTLLESVYVYTGLPWWASLAVVAVGVRVALLKPSLDASENSLKHQELLKDPKYAAANEEMKRMIVSGNHLAGAEARARVSLMNKAAGYSMWRNFVPMLQIPVGVGMFRLIKDMSALPVPSFESGGLLWFTDLTVADPLFILPIVTGIMMMCGMRIPLPYMAPAQAKMMSMMSLVIMPVSTIVALFFPSGLNWYFFLSALLHSAQAFFLHQQWFRRLIGLKPLAQPLSPTEMGWQAPRVIDISAPRVTPVHQVPAAGSQSVMESFRATIADAKKSLDQRADKGSVQRAQKAAREYDEKRALEEKEKLIARLQQKKRAKVKRY